MIAYREIIEAQLKGFNKYAPIKEGDYAVVLDSPEKGFRERDIVKVQKIVGEFAFVSKHRRSKTGFVHVDNLEKIKMVALTTDKNEAQMIPVGVEQVTTLKDIDPELFAYFGKRIRQIFSDKMTEQIGDKILPKINPKIVIADFFGYNAEGFVAKWGEDKGVVFVSSKAQFPVDEVVSHEFTHILSFYSKEIAEQLGDKSIQFGITDEEMDEEDILGGGDKNQEKYRHMDEHELQKAKQEEYYLQPAEVSAHTEQMLYLVHKLKRIDAQHVALSDDMSPEEKQRAIQEIQSRPLGYYKRQVMNKLVPYAADKYKIKDFTARKIYESLFDNIENYIPNSPK